MLGGPQFDTHATRLLAALQQQQATRDRLTLGLQHVVDIPGYGQNLLLMANINSLTWSGIKDRTLLRTQK